MSSRHATMSIWQRNEEGGYAAELNGFALAVRWRDETAHQPRGFFWSTVSPTGTRVAAKESEEEIEVAMSIAEDVANGRPHE